MWVWHVILLHSLTFASYSNSYTCFSGYLRSFLPSFSSLNSFCSRFIPESAFLHPLSSFIYPRSLALPAFPSSFPLCFPVLGLHPLPSPATPPPLPTLFPSFLMSFHLSITADLHEHLLKFSLILDTKKALNMSQGKVMVESSTTNECCISTHIFTCSRNQFSELSFIWYLHLSDFLVIVSFVISRKKSL